MSRILVILVFDILLGTGITLAAPVPQPGPKKPFHPTAKGTEWVYEYEGGTYTKTITKSEETDAGRTITLNMQQEEGEITEWVLWVSDKGIADLGKYRGELENPVDLVKLPAREGDSWKVKRETAKAVQYEGKVTVGKPEQVEVPAGKFECLRLEWDYTIGKRKVERTYWYAPSVGMVKTKTSDYELMLKSFKLGKD